MVGVITPWNFPIAIPSWKIAPALVCGNTVVFKPATDTPLLGERFVELLIEAGLPSGVINIVHGGGGAVGDRLVRHPDVPVITLTGSRETGVEVMRNAAENLKHVHLELGGKNAIIVPTRVSFSAPVLYATDVATTPPLVRLPAGAATAKVPTDGGFRDVQLGADLRHRQAPVLGQQTQQGTPTLTSVLGVCGFLGRAHLQVPSLITTAADRIGSYVPDPRRLRSNRSDPISLTPGGLWLSGAGE